LGIDAGLPLEQQQQIMAFVAKGVQDGVVRL